MAAAGKPRHHLLEQKIKILEEERAQYLQEMQTVRESEQRFRELAEMAADGIILSSRNGKITWINSSAADIFCMEKDVLPDKNLRDLFPPHVLEEKPLRFDLLDHGQKVVKEREILRPDGKQVFVEMHSRQMPDGSYHSIVRDVTSRRQIEQTLNESNALQRKALEFSRLLLDTSPAFIVAIDFDGKIILMNQALLNALEYTLDEVKGADYLTTFIPDEEHEELTFVFSSLIEKKEHTLNENRIVSKSGRTYLVEWHGRAIYSAEAEANFFVGIGIDITSRKESELALQESEVKFRTVAEYSPIAILLHQNNKWIYANPVATELSGFSLQELQNMNFWNAVHPDDRQMVQERGIKRQRGESVISRYECRIITKDGHTKWVDLSGAVISIGGIPAIIVSILDITESKRMEAELRQSEERYRTILEEMEDAYLELDIEGNITFFNDAFLKIIGYKRDEIFGTNFNRYVANEKSSEEIYRAVNNVYKTEVPLKNFQCDILRKDGVRRTVEVHTFVWRDTNRRVIGFRSIARDITERLRSEAEKEKLSQQLFQAQKMESVGRLAGGVAHDFNNMLGVILGHAEMALANLDQSQLLYSDLVEIRKAAERSADLTRQLLAYARKQTITPRVLDFNKMVEGSLKMLRRLIGEDISLVWRPGANMGQVRMDASQIDQLLTNLCLNARDAITGGGQIVIETANITVNEKELLFEHKELLAGEYVLLGLSDNGCGMDEETVHNIFEPFFTTKGIGRGTGLGMSTVYGIVKQNHGLIKIQSEPGQGTTVRIYLPKYLDSSPERQREKTPELLRRGNETILLVEDEPAILNIGSLMLERLGYKVLAASSPSKAIEQAKEHTGEINLLMTDVIMPEMNGRDLAKRLAAIYPKLKFLFMSGYTADVINHHSALDEDINFIQKPFQLNELAASLRRALDQK